MFRICQDYSSIASYSSHPVSGRLGAMITIVSSRPLVGTLLWQRTIGKNRVEVRDGSTESKSANTAEVLTGLVPCGTMLGVMVVQR